MSVQELIRRLQETMSHPSYGKLKPQEKEMVQDELAKAIRHQLQVKATRIF